MITPTESEAIPATGLDVNGWYIKKKVQNQMSRLYIFAFSGGATYFAPGFIGTLSFSKDSPKARN